MVTVTISSSAGQLAALHDGPAGPPPTRGPVGAVVCHPHPLHGGTKENKVVHAVAKRLAGAGLHVLRFDFRGAGGSEGQHDGGRGEQQDVLAAIDHVHGLCAGPLLVAGFSFGSWVGLTTAVRDPRVTALLAIAPPVNHYDYGAVGRGGPPLAVIYAEDDELVPAADVRAFIAACSPAPHVTAVSDSGHLFHARLSPLRQGVTAFLSTLA